MSAKDYIPTKEGDIVPWTQNFLAVANANLPTWNDDVKFENLITSYFNDLDRILSYGRFGRLGQKQFRLDIYSTRRKRTGYLNGKRF